MRRSFALTVILVVALGACGSGTERASSKISTLDLVAGAPARAAAAKTARIEMSMQLPGVADGKPYTMKGAVDFERAAMEMSLNLRDFSPEAPDTKIQARLVDGAMYIGFGSLFDSPGAPPSLRGKRWLELRFGDLGLPDGLASQQSNPADILQTLQGAGDVRRVGEATIRGEHTTEYAAEVDLRKALDRLGPEVGARLKDAVKQFDRSTFPVRVWIGDDQLPRREVIEMKVKGESATMSMDFFDYGVDVQVEKPPASETGSFSDLLRLNAGSGTTN